MQKANRFSRKVLQFTALLAAATVLLGLLVPISGRSSARLTSSAHLVNSGRLTPVGVPTAPAARRGLIPPAPKPTAPVVDEGSLHSHQKLGLLKTLELESGSQSRVRPASFWHGWHEIQDSTTLVGTVEQNDYNEGKVFEPGDQDWLLKVKPVPGYERLLTNTQGKINSGDSQGVVECEIQTIHSDKDYERRCFDRLLNKQVTMVGDWVEDTDHNSKTEIHPITSIACRDGEFIYLYVFSDASSFDAITRHYLCPHHGENRVAHIQMPIPHGYTFSVQEEVDQARSKSIRIVSDASGTFLIADIQSGMPKEGKGFYFAALSLRQLPTISSLSPPSLPAESPPFTLSVEGSGFGSNSEVRWNGLPRPTRELSSTLLSAVIPATDIATAGTIQITVLNPFSLGPIQLPFGDTSNAVAFTVTPRRQATITVLTSSVNPSPIGQRVTFTAIVTGLGGTPSGTVQFAIDGSNAGSPIALSGATAMYSLSTLAPGSHTITATYSGGGIFTASASVPLTQTVNLAPTSTVLASSPNPAKPGQPVAFNATVKGTGGAPSGTVQFTIDGKNAGTPVPLLGGMAAYPVLSLPVGPHTVTAAYSGDALFAGSLSLALTQTVQGTSFKVTSSGDSPTDPGSLRYAITYAAPGATIDLSQVPASAITLTNGPLTIGQDLSLIGPGLYGFLAIDGNNASSVFVITGGNVQMAGLVIQHGKSLYGGGINEQGGGLTLTRCLLSQNTSTDGGTAFTNGSGGAGIYDDHSPLALTNCLFSQNNATDGLGGGLFNNGGSTVSLTDTTFTGNASIAGGGVLTGLGGMITVSGCTFSGNSTVNNGGAAGGGFYNNGIATLTNSTVATNTAADIGGLYNHGSMALTNCTISGNRALSGPGGGLGNSGALTLTNTLVAGNTANAGNPDVFHFNGTPFTSRGYNLIGADDTAGTDGFSSTDQVGTSARPLDPKLGPLQNNGGMTATRALLPGSPALDKIPAKFPSVDQRGQLRPGNPDGRADIGAYEAAPSLIVTDAGDDPSDTHSLRFIVNHAAAGDTITFQLPSPATITLDGNNGRLAISKALSLAGPGADHLAIDGNAATGVFLLNGFLNWTIFGGPVSLSGLTIQHGQSQPGDLYGGSGGIFEDHGTLTLTGCTLDHNSSPFGGGIFSLSGNIRMEGCTLSSNRAEDINGSGGGILNDDATLWLENCTISGNTSGKEGGGGLNNTFGSLTLKNSTVAGNTTSGEGGGITNAGHLTLSDSIVAGNMASAGQPDVFVLPNPSLLVTSGGYNVIGNGDGIHGFLDTDQVGTGPTPLNALVGPLAYNGGPTQTRTLLPGSPALDKIPAGFPATDQRGVSRPQNADGRADIGTCEVQKAAAVTALTSNTALTTSPNPSAVGGPATFTATVTGSGGTPTGIVQFAVDGSSVGPSVVLDSGGRGNYTTSTLPVGTHAVTAVYRGDAYFAPSASAALTQVVTANPATGPASVLTQHNDNARTGSNLHETTLDTRNVSSDQFGKLFSRPVDGQIYAQPLYVPKVGISGQGMHNVVYVATMNNSVYAFDADDPLQATALWRANLGASVPYNFMPLRYRKNGYDISPSIGITSTPVIDSETATIYLVAKTVDGDGGIRYRLHALDITTGQERQGSPVIIEASVVGTGDGSQGGLLAFDPMRQLQRPGLLLANGIVYFAFASHQDTGPYHGWIFGYNARTLAPQAVFCTTPFGEQGGIWQAGNGIAADGEGNLYVMTGNGTFDATSGRPDLGCSFIKLSPDLSVLDWFTPYNYDGLNGIDADLGSAGPLLLPGTNLLVGGGKSGVFYLLDRSNLGHLGPHRDEWNGPMPPVQVFQASEGPDFPINLLGAGFHHIHGSPVAWDTPSDGPLVYIWAERDFLRAFRFDRNTQQFQTAPIYTSIMRAPTGSGIYPQRMPGGILSLSANGSTPGTGVLWASIPIDKDANHEAVPGVLRAFDASNVGRELWNSQMISGDELGLFAKFCPPTVAGGKVYMATFSNQLVVYGLVPVAPGGPRFATGFELGQPWPTWQDAVDDSHGVRGYYKNNAPECSVRRELAHTGGTALLYSGSAPHGVVSINEAAYCYCRVFAVNIPVDRNTKMSYYILPQQDNGRFVGVDLHCTDGTTLRDSGAVDYEGHPMHPHAGHGGRIPLDAWTRIRCDIGNWLNGRVIDKISVGYDRTFSGSGAFADGRYRGYIDDLWIGNPSAGLGVGFI